MENETNELKAKVLDRIRRGELTMHSQLYFGLRLVTLIVVLFLALVVSVLLFAFLSFTIRVNFHAPVMDPLGRTWFFFLHFFPWRLLFLDVILVVCAEWLLRSFRFAYRSPVLYLLFGLLALALALALFIDHTGFNDVMLDHARERGLPAPFNDMYENAHHPEMDLM